jgi:hypothetical protein
LIHPLINYNNDYKPLYLHKNTRNYMEIHPTQEGWRQLGRGQERRGEKKEGGDGGDKKNGCREKKHGGENKKGGGVDDKKGGDESKGDGEDKKGESKKNEVHIGRYVIKYVLSRSYQAH